MAFISQDWRDPGNIYIKSDTGHWEPTKLCRIRIFEMLNENFIKRAFRQSISEFENGSNAQSDYLHETFQNTNLCGFYQPHVIIKQISTKESMVLTSLSEALLSLDFKVAIRDPRRFGYVCRVIQIFITERLPYLSGRIQLYIIELLKEISKQALKTQTNTNLVRDLLKDLKSTLIKNKYNHVGSFKLWGNNLAAVDAMNESLDTLIFNKEKEFGVQMFDNLPQECLLEILTNLTSPKDLEMIGETSFTLKKLVNDELLWKKMVELHFTNEQLQCISRDQATNSDHCNWRFTYCKLLFKFGDRHYFPIKLGKCLKCSNIFWPIFGHPCTSDNIKENYKSLSPEDFVNLFQV